MRFPPGLIVDYPTSSSPLVCRLQKSLYGLRQASCQWYIKLLQAFYSRGYSHSPNDHSLFIKRSNASIVLLAVYVDDIIVSGDDLDDISAFLNSQFHIKDLVVLNYFLGIEVFSSDAGLLLHQKKFITNLLTDFGCDVVSPITCPLDLSVKLKANMGSPLPNPESYRSLVGKLNFLTHTQPDLSFVVQHLSQFLQMQAALHLLRYLKGTSTMGIFFS